MRVWDLPVAKLCDKHLLAQHAEIHAIYNIITQNKKGYANHPEVKRWQNHSEFLIVIHDITTIEMVVRNMNHNSELPVIDMFKLYLLPSMWQSVEQQIEILRKKGCKCRV